MPGNCYQFLTLVAVKVRVDGGSQYDNIKALSNIVFKDKSTIDDLLVDLWEVQQRARTMGDKTMDADMMRGTQDCTLDYEEVIAELRNLDGNRKPEKHLHPTKRGKGPSLILSRLTAVTATNNAHPSLDAKWNAGTIYRADAKPRTAQDTTHQARKAHKQGRRQTSSRDLFAPKLVCATGLVV